MNHKKTLRKAILLINKVKIDKVTLKNKILKMEASQRDTIINKIFLFKVIKMINKSNFNNINLYKHKSHLHILMQV